MSGINNTNPMNWIKSLQEYKPGEQRLYVKDGTLHVERRRNVFIRLIRKLFRMNDYTLIGVGSFLRGKATEVMKTQGYQAVSDTAEAASARVRELNVTGHLADPQGPWHTDRAKLITYLGVWKQWAQRVDHQFQPTELKEPAWESLEIAEEELKSFNIL